MNKFKSVMFAATALFAISGTSLGHEFKVAADINDPVTLRINIMKNVGQATEFLGKMMKGEADFNAQTALASLMVINNAALGMDSLFPEGFESSVESTTAPAVWQNEDGFDVAISKFIVDSGAAVAAKPADLDALGAVFGLVAGNCRSCHQDFRLRH